jgi:hypothetical protein
MTAIWWYLVGLSIQATVSALIAASHGRQLRRMADRTSQLERWERVRRHEERKQHPGDAEV